ncbi:mechanosensitive ion channel family protein [Ochrovirga pacifica]|uniref:mechanosensitive ion channel family protein n=1 Tax=Ochrovirga pacifica TaxID=1042376 RepID=UPI00025583C7|nr:mechanosensitive ion channel family protein [Ochrovirga pacifica]
MTKKLYFLFILFTTVVFAQNDEVKVDLSSPYKTIYTHLYFLQPDSFDAKKAAATIYGENQEKSEEISIKIKQVLDGKGLRVDMESLPTEANYKDTLSSGIVKNKYILFPEVMPEIYVEKIAGKWYYGRETNLKIDALYKSVFPPGTEFIKRIIPNIGHKKFLGIELWQYLGMAIFITIATLLFWLLNRLIIFVLQRLESLFIKFSHDSLSTFFAKLARPSSLLIIFYILEVYIPMLQFGIDINSFLIKGLEIAQTVLWIYVFLQIVNVLIEVYLSYTAKTESKLDDQLAPILSRLMRILVVFLGVLKMLTVFGVNTSTVIAGASIGGLAVALASQDTVKNLIGTFMIFLDKPFQIGDWIDGGGVVGTVEEVGFRSSKIRAADTSLYYIPNSKLSEIVINNFGLRLFRRYNTTLGIRYDTPPELIEAFTEGVRRIIKKSPLTVAEKYNVEFVGYGDSSLNIMVNMYFESLDWNKEQSSKHALNMEILKLAAALGVEFAFPSQTLMIEQFPDKTTIDMNYNVDKEQLKNVIDRIDK